MKIRFYIFACLVFLAGNGHAGDPLERPMSRGQLIAYVLKIPRAQADALVNARDTKRSSTYVNGLGYETQASYTQREEQILRIYASINPEKISDWKTTLEANVANLKKIHRSNPTPEREMAISLLQSTIERISQAQPISDPNATPKDISISGIMAHDFVQSIRREKNLPGGTRPNPTIPDPGDLAGWKNALPDADESALQSGEIEKRDEQSVRLAYLLLLEQRAPQEIADYLKSDAFDYESEIKHSPQTIRERFAVKHAANHCAKNWGMAEEAKTIGQQIIDAGGNIEERFMLYKDAFALGKGDKLSAFTKAKTIALAEDPMAAFRAYRATFFPEPKPVEPKKAEENKAPTVTQIPPPKPMAEPSLSTKIANQISEARKVQHTNSADRMYSKGELVGFGGLTATAAGLAVAAAKRWVPKRSVPVYIQSPAHPEPTNCRVPLAEFALNPTRAEGTKLKDTEYRAFKAWFDKNHTDRRWEFNDIERWKEETRSHQPQGEPTKPTASVGEMSAPPSAEPSEEALAKILDSVEPGWRQRQAKEVGKGEIK